MIESEMNNYERCDFTSQVYEMLTSMRDQYMVTFSRSVDFSTDALNARPVRRDPNENELIDSSRLIYNCVRDLRNALLLIPQPDADNEFEIDQQQQNSSASLSANSGLVYLILLLLTFNW